MVNKLILSAILVFTLSLTGCVSESHQVVQSASDLKEYAPYNGPKTNVAIGKFNNQSDYQSGIFSDGVDYLGNQSKEILLGQLQQSHHFNVLDRANMKALATEASYGKKNQAIKGASYIISGAVTEFGRKEVGDHQLWGILGKGKQQVAYSKVRLNVINIETSQVVYSVSGAGEYALSTREIIGFGGQSSYDSTLNSKVLSLAISEAVHNLVSGIDSGKWKPSESK